VSIQEIYDIFKRFLMEGDTRLAGLILLVGVTSFGLGRMSISDTPYPNEQGRENDALIINATGPTREAGVSSTENTVRVAETPSEGGYVASKNGTKYHLPWCGSAKQIKEENKIWFPSKEAAEAAGYTPASNCKGI
jgi:hypothetical protein